jgi:DNA-binding IclR family transcriptional regulator
LLNEILERQGATLGELAQEFEKPRSSVHDHMKTLMSLGIILHEEQEYHLTTELLNMGARSRNQRAIYRTAKPKIEELAQETGQMVGLMTIEQGLGVTLYYYNKLTDLELEPYPGLRTRLHTTSGGKAMLAELPESSVSKIVNKHGLQPKTKYTITNYESLLSQLNTIRKQGYAYSSQERVIGMRSIGAAITDRDGLPVGAIVVGGTIQQMEEGSQNEESFKETLLDFINIIEVNLNYT